MEYFHTSKDLNSLPSVLPKVAYPKLLIQHITFLINVRNRVESEGLKAGIKYYNSVMVEFQRWVHEELPGGYLDKSGYFLFTSIATANNKKTYLSRLNSIIDNISYSQSINFPIY